MKDEKQKRWDSPIPMIKKIGTVVLDKDIKVEDIILRGKLGVSVLQGPSKGNNTNYYELYARADKQEVPDAGTAEEQS